MPNTRRDFMVKAGAGIAAGLLAPRRGWALDPYAADPKLKIRKNVASPDAAADLASMRTGVAAMKTLAQSKPADPRGWIKQAFLHGDCTRFTFCQHGNWFFPPWHRSFIFYFEDLIRFYSGDENFALPYWDWSRTHGVPASFYGPDNALDDTVSVSSMCAGAPTPGRGRSVNDRFSQADLDAFVGPAVINSIQQNPDYATYGGGNPGGGALERTPHNFVHRWVGGTKGSNMVRTYSPLDPIFWLHHCNIDRLYSNWLARAGHNPPQQAAWKDKSFNDFFDRKGQPAGSQFTCAMTVDSAVMGYTYDVALEAAVSLAAEGKVPVEAEVLDTASASESKVEAGVLAFVVKPPTRNTRNLMNAAAAESANYVVRLRIEGVKAPAKQDTGVFVFLGAGTGKDTPITAPGYIGSFTFFDGQAGEGGGGHAGHEGGATILLDATEAFQMLHGDARLPDGENLTVSLVTRPLYQGIDSYASVEEVKPQNVHFDIVDLKN